MDNPYIFTNFSGGIDDVFYNSFDITWAKRSPEESPTPRVFTKLPIEAAEDDGSVTYTYNSDFFRCDEFTKDHDNKKHILFAGCSQTEGVGAPLETIWPKVLLSGLNSNASFFSIAKAGYGWQKIITNFMIYVDKYGAPDYLFALLPNLGRFFIWEDNQYKYIQRYPNGKTIKNKNKAPDGVFVEQEFTNQEHKRCFIDFSISWKLFEKYCESIGTKILWSSWDLNENNNYRLANISNNYIHLQESELLGYIADQRPDGKLNEYDLYRRDGHSGILVNE